MKYLILELNEFNHKILKDYSSKNNYKYITKILNYNHTKTFTNDVYKGNNNQDGFLDPWTQWVSIHTLKPSIHHKVKNLGDVPKLKFRQFWEIKKKINFYIWGSMNVSRRNSNNVKLFFPDPWVFSEKAYPNNFNKVLNPIKKTIKNRGSDNFLQKFSDFIKVTSEIKKYIGLFTIFKSIIKSIADYIKFRKNYVFFCHWEYLCFKVLLKIIKNKKNFISIYFVNSLAHVQHHYWEIKKYNKEIEYCLKYIDKMIQDIYKNKSYKVIIINALSQKNSEKKQLCLYEQISHTKFLNILGIKFLKIEKLMTNDAYIFFKNKKEVLNCKKILNSIKFKNKKIFHVEIIDDNKIFYKTNFIKRVFRHDFIIIGNKKIKFLDYFNFITVRRGIHTQNGDILSEKKLFPQNIENHNFLKYIK